VHKVATHQPKQLLAPHALQVSFALKVLQRRVSALREHTQLLERGFVYNVLKDTIVLCSHQPQFNVEVELTLRQEHQFVWRALKVIFVVWGLLIHHRVFKALIAQAREVFALSVQQGHGVPHKLQLIPYVRQVLIL
jgi:hypothetical protein